MAREALCFRAFCLVCVGVWALTGASRFPHAGITTCDEQDDVVFDSSESSSPEDVSSFFTRLVSVKAGLSSR